MKFDPYGYEITNQKWPITYDTGTHNQSNDLAISQSGEIYVTSPIYCYKIIHRNGSDLFTGESFIPAFN